MDNSIKILSDSMIKSLNPSKIKTTELSEVYNDISNISYKVIQDNWYKALPYGFKFTSRQTGESDTFFLPISPQNMTITTQFATNIIPTLYGVVEEHSENKFYDIVIEGTTGISSKIFKFLPGNGIGYGDDGRSSYMAADDPTQWAVLGNMHGFGGMVGSATTQSGLMSTTTSLGELIVQKTQEILGGKKRTHNIAGVAIDNNGYTYFHDLYRKLLMYKADAAGYITDKKQPGKKSYPKGSYPLLFLNYKDNNQYNCIIRNFTLKRDVNNPILYKYSIIMRCFNLTTVAQKPGDYEFDTDTILAFAGLKGVKSGTLLTIIKQKAENARSILGAGIGMVNIIGR